MIANIIICAVILVATFLAGRLEERRQIVDRYRKNRKEVEKWLKELAVEEIPD